MIEPATPEQRQLVERGGGDGHRLGPAQAQDLGGARPRSQRVRHRARRGDRQHRGHRRACWSRSPGTSCRRVVAHEMAHIQNLDVRLMTLLAGMVGAIALMSDGMGRMLRGGRQTGGGRSGGRRRQRGGGRGGNPLGARDAGALAADAGRGAGGLPHSGDGGEPEARVPGRRHRRAVHPQPAWRSPPRWRSSRRPPRRPAPSPGAPPTSASWIPRRGCCRQGRASWPT